MEIGAAETKGTHAAAPRPNGGNRPRPQLGIDVKRRVSKVNIRAGMIAMQTGRQHLVVQRQGGLQQSGGAGTTLKMSEVRFDRAEGHRTGGEMKTPQYLNHALRFNHITYPRRGAVAFNVCHGG